MVLMSFADLCSETVSTVLNTVEKYVCQVWRRNSCSGVTGPAEDAVRGQGAGGLGGWQHICSSSISRSYQQSFHGHASAASIPRGELRPSVPALSLVPTAKHKQAELLSAISMFLGLPQD